MSAANITFLEKDQARSVMHPRCSTSTSVTAESQNACGDDRGVDGARDARARLVGIDAIYAETVRKLEALLEEREQLAVTLKAADERLATLAPGRTRPLRQTSRRSRGGHTSSRS